MTARTPAPWLLLAMLLAGNAALASNMASSSQGAGVRAVMHAL